MGNAREHDSRVNFVSLRQTNKRGNIFSRVRRNRREENKTDWIRIFVSMLVFNLRRRFPTEDVINDFSQFSAQTLILVN